jgi:glycosyltransferase involved in cell wall biosynthesis
VSEEPLRVAFFPDSYHEIDGVANTSRQFESFALRRGLPFLNILGWSDPNRETKGSVTRLALRRGPIGFRVDKKHDFDLLFTRYLKQVESEIRKFNPDIIHITGPSDVGILGLTVAHRLQIPLAASWHTNLHEYAEQRGKMLVSWLPSPLKSRIGTLLKQGSLLATLRFYHAAQILFAPNQELIELLEKGTRKPCYLMQRGVDTNLFDPRQRNRSDDSFVIGYVGRLTTEKNIRLLAEIERGLESAGLSNFRFLIVGQGAEEPWLKANMRHADFTGVLRGEALARAYTNMDIFVFPSRTDTYGNVVLEAFASGVPAIVTDGGGPRFVIRPGETGFVAHDVSEFVTLIQNLINQPPQLATMRSSARTHAMTASWDAVFESVYANYERGLRNGSAAGKKIRIRSEAIRSEATHVS